MSNWKRRTAQKYTVRLLLVNCKFVAAFQDLHLELRITAEFLTYLCPLFAAGVLVQVKIRILIYFFLNNPDVSTGFFNTITFFFLNCNRLFCWLVNWFYGISALNEVFKNEFSHFKVII